MNAKEERKRLVNMLQSRVPSFHVSKVQAVESNRVELLGGKLPAYFDKADRKLIVWGRGNRWSGAEVDVETLQTVENVCLEWYRTLIV